MLLDFVTERNPNWIERLPADLGTTLIELFAYAGDSLSYFQDGAATEAYFDTARHRISVKRHARLVDYRMHDGRNAQGFVQFNARQVGTIEAGTRLTTRIDKALIGAVAPPGPVIPPDVAFDRDPALAGVTVFESITALAVRPEHNELRIHTWGQFDCCLAANTTELFVYCLDATGQARRSVFSPGDHLLIEEVRSATTGEPVDADPAHRWIVQLVRTEDTTDEAYTAQFASGALTPRLNPADPALPLQRLSWSIAEALPQAIQVSAVGADLLPIDPVTIARGNVAAVDHGLTMVLDSERGQIGLPVDRGGRHPLATLPVAAGPLTMTGRDTPLEALPAIRLRLSFTGQDDETWAAVPDLLDSTPYDQHFVAEVDDDERPQLRFGDDQYGRAPREVKRVQLTMRRGNGRGGNIGAGSLVHAATASGLIDRIYQPLAAQGGVDPQSITEVQKLAPVAFQAVQLRAVTEADWQEMALRHPEVLDARVIIRWTGSWHTIFVAIHPRDEANLLPTAGGGFALEPSFAAGIERHLRRFRQPARTSPW